MRRDLLRVIPRSATNRAFLYHFGVGLMVFVLMTVLANGLAGRVARQEAVRNATWSGRTIAVGLIAPLLTPGVLVPGSGDRSTLDRVVRSRIASGSVVRIKVWAADGTILYSDDANLIGQRFELDEDDQAVLRNGGVASDLSSADRAENKDEQQFGDLIEVYARATDTDGQPVLVETYFPVTEVEARASELQRRMLPVVLIALILMELLLLPLSIWLTRRADRADRARQAEKAQAVEAIQSERRRLAAELHDGVIQDLSAVGYALTSVQAGLDDDAPEALDRSHIRRLVRRTADIVRTDIVTLRGLMTSMYETPERHVDLAPRIRELVAEMADDDVTAEVADLPELPEQVAASVFQVARESLRNAVRHSGSPVQLDLRVLDGHLLLTVRDHGSGYHPDRVAGPEGGHLGLSLLRDASARAGGRLEIEARPGAGVVVRLAVPVTVTPNGRGAGPESGRPLAGHVQ